MTSFHVPPLRHGLRRGGGEDILKNYLTKAETCDLLIQLNQLKKENGKADPFFKEADPRRFEERIEGDDRPLAGARVREVLEKVLGEEKRSLRVVLDFSGMGSIDFSWADEVVAKMISRLWSGEYGEKFLVLKNLSSSQAENIDVALERKRLALLITGPEGWRLIGSLNNYLIHTLNRVMEKKQLPRGNCPRRKGLK